MRVNRQRMKVWLPCLVLLLGVGVLGAIREERIGGDIAWARNYEAGLAQARSERKPLLFSFHTPGCGWCKKMDAETYTDPQVLSLARRFVCIRLDSERDTSAVARYGVFEYPTLLIADPEGQTLARVSSYVPPERLASALQETLHTLRKQP